MKKFKTPEEYISHIESELESANHHEYIDLPEKLFNRIKESDIAMDEELDLLELARIIAEEFDKNI